MYDEMLKTSGKFARSNRAFVEAAIKEYEESAQPVKTARTDVYANERNMVMESVMNRDAVSNRYHTFAATVRSALVLESMYKILKESVSEEIRADHVSTSILRAMVSEYVNEHGYIDIMNRMKTASVATSHLYNIITENAQRMLENVDKSNSDTFRIDPDMKDEFFKQLDYSDSQAISDAIHQRVSDAMEDFVSANTKDHEDITAALQQAQEKIGDVPEEKDELRECYSMMGKRKVTEIRNRPKGVFHSMVSAMCESVMKNKEMHTEFMKEGKLDMQKIVARTHLMYTFMEMLNTTRIAKVDTVFIEGVIADLSK